MSLQQIQIELAESLLSKEAVSDHVKPVAHLVIYQNNILVHLIKTLRSIYSLTLRLVGEEFFSAAAHAYCQQYPSRRSHLHEYGEYFSIFLKDYLRYTPWDYLVEIAAFEWLSHTLQFADHATALDPSVLAKLSPEDYHRLRLALHPASHLVFFHYPLLDIVAYAKGEKEEWQRDSEKQATPYLLIRRDCDVEICPLTLSEYTFLSALHENQTLSQALAQATEIEPHFNGEKKLWGWIKDQTLSSFILAPSSRANRPFLLNPRNKIEGEE